MAQVNDIQSSSPEQDDTVTVRPSSPWQPLRQPVFRTLWLATVVSNIGSWMNDVGVNWSMLTLSSDPLAVALVQASSSLPMFLFALPSGVMADIVDRRKYLLFSQVWVFIVAASLTLLSAAGLVTPWVLLLAAFLLSTGAAMSSPPFQAIVPDLVTKDELGPAIALNSLGINISRAIGPALGGLILSFTSPWLVFLLNALSVTGVALVLYRWKSEPTIQRLPPEHFFQAVRVGLRYIYAAPVFRNVLVRTCAFFLFGSAGWALLPLVARTEMHQGPGGYGMMLASIGVGAISGAVLMPRLRKRFSADALMMQASVLFGLMMLGMAFIRHFWWLNLCEFFIGLAWITILSTLNLGAQRSAARWVKARALAVYLTAFFGSMTIGSTVWGQLAAHYSIPFSLSTAAIGLILSCTVVWRWRLDKDPDLDLDIATHRNSSTLQPNVHHSRGPVMVSYEYRIRREDAHDFTVCMQDMRRMRRRSGAINWAIYEDVLQPGIFVETFVVDSWMEHLREQERYTMDDKKIQTRVNTFHQGEQVPEVRYLVAPF
ncbi:MFS transporter [Mangrovibacter phragmitis]|uniref:MFS transporter n=1 Tax=Mangrovibacter phragmitis TaxID=1691903 RepID=A0A1B7L5W0_9ENTR|nr:MFS transporter [Mangrovibacter phragmitis]OAT77727.1 MFS transporter [Mangrovibacter phragmitis]